MFKVQSNSLGYFIRDEDTNTYIQTDGSIRDSFDSRGEGNFYYNSYEHASTILSRYNQHEFYVLKVKLAAGQMYFLENNGVGGVFTTEPNNARRFNNAQDAMQVQVLSRFPESLEIVKIRPKVVTTTVYEETKVSA